MIVFEVWPWGYASSCCSDLTWSGFSVFWPAPLRNQNDTCEAWLKLIRHRNKQNFILVQYFTSQIYPQWQNVPAEEWCNLCLSELLVFPEEMWVNTLWIYLFAFSNLLDESARENNYRYLFRLVLLGVDLCAYFCLWLRNAKIGGATQPHPDPAPSFRTCPKTLTPASL